MTLPDPSGRPVAVRPQSKLLSLLKGMLTTGIAVAGGGAFLILVAGVLTPTMGGRRSTRLKWQEQQRQAEDAANHAMPDKQSQPHHE